MSVQDNLRITNLDSQGIGNEGKSTPTDNDGSLDCHSRGDKSEEGDQRFLHFGGLS